VTVVWWSCVCAGGGLSEVAELFDELLASQEGPGRALALSIESHRIPIASHPITPGPPIHPPPPVSDSRVVRHGRDAGRTGSISFCFGCWAGEPVSSASGTNAPSPALLVAAAFSLCSLSLVVSPPWSHLLSRPSSAHQKGPLRPPIITLSLLATEQLLLVVLPIIVCSRPTETLTGDSIPLAIPRR
jgi:hypothetical protein